ncbi:TCR/Tet family MFS transporter [Sphingobacterium sp. SYP-B4668]|uniref:TCR/Tet family MFS transporter n=1 Tax=Sphingobacterium sp. SYP-B4668 TaxID=2996035 RepID=UPI0022DD0A6D|nr:TCR/Tet family MFS transporter [Sphingobacterium sp. SYP-B4668]
MQQQKNSGLLFIFITVAIDVIGLGIIIPVLPTLIKQLTGGTLSEASEYGGWLMFSYAVTQFVFASVLGNLSDRYGRRPVLLLSLLGFCINYLLMGLATSILWLFIGRLVAGITGASMTVAAAYTADISTPDRKAQNFGLLSAAFGIGFIIGPVLGGLLGQYGPRVPFFAAAVISFLNFAYGYLLVPESLKKENRRPFVLKNANPIGAFKHFAKYPLIKPLIVCIFLINVAAHAVQSTWSYYTMERYGWDERMVGISMGFIGVLLAVVQAGLLRIIIPKLGLPKSIVIGFGLYVFAFPMMAFSYEPWMLFVASVPFVFAGIGGPAVQSFISNHTPDNEQGQIQGGITSIVSLTAIIGPPLMSNIFAFFTNHKHPTYFPGAPFLMASVLCLVATIIAIIYFKKRNQSSEF